MRINLEMQCNECKRRNYSTSKNKKTQIERLERKKYCPFCRRHIVHREVKK